MDLYFQLIGESLLHFLWQGALIASVLGLFLYSTPEHLSRIRHLAASLALIAMLITPVLTVIYLENSASASERPVQDTVSATTAAPETKALNSVERSSSLAPIAPSRGWPHYLVYGWLLGVFIFSVRTGAGLLVIRRWRHEHIRPAPDWLGDLFKRECERFGLAGQIQMRVSAGVDVPMVVGWFRPLILLPLQMVTGLTAHQWTAIIDHELAHVMRKDHLMNCVTAIAETLLFYHPAVWWVSRQIRLECECCCDELAAEATGDKIAYARALTGIAAFRAQNVKMALYVNGGGLSLRIRRLLRVKTPLNGPKGHFRLLLGGSMIITLSSFIPLLMLQQPGKPPQPAQPYSAAGASILFQEHGGYPLVRQPIHWGRRLYTRDHPGFPVVPPTSDKYNTPLDDFPSLHPLQNGQAIVSGFGLKIHPILQEERHHKGADFVCETGAPVYATAKGTVLFSEEQTAYGIQVQIQHGEAYTTRYAHLSAQYVKQGDLVEAGDLIAACGNSGLSVRPHLHYEIMEKGSAVDPEPFLPIN